MPTSFDAPRRTPRGLALALVFAVACGLGAASAAVARASSTLPPELRTWSEIEKDATHLLGRRIRCVVQLSGRVERWSSYVTRFGPRQFDAFQLWTDEQLPWQVDDFETPCVRLFARRDSDASYVLASGRRYARFEIEGTLRELFLGVPWIEVEDVRELDLRLTEGTVIHASRALSLIENGAWKLAESELGIALQASMPQRSRLELERLKAECLDHAGERIEYRPMTPPRPWRGAPTKRTGSDG